MFLKIHFSYRLSQKSIKGHINGIPLTLHQFQTNGKLSVSLYLIFITKCAKMLESCTKLVKLKLLIQFFGGELALETCLKFVFNCRNHFEKLS